MVEIYEPTWYLVAAGVVGVAAGLFYFGGLWVTIRRLPTTRHPTAWALGSFAVRTAVAVAAIYTVHALRPADTTGDWQILVACLVALVITRIAVVRLLGSAREVAEEEMEKGRTPPGPPDASEVGEPPETEAADETSEGGPTP